MESEVKELGDMEELGDMTDYAKPLTAKEISERIGCTIQHNYKMAERNKIPHYRIGSFIRFPADVVETHILKTPEK